MLRFRKIRSCAVLLSLAAVLASGLVAQKNATYADFVRRFQQARELNDKKGIFKILRENPDQAVAYFKVQVDAFSLQNDQKAGNLVEEMRQLFKEAWKSDLLFKVEQGRAGLDPTEINMIRKILTQRRVAWNLFEAAKKSQKEREFRNAIDGMQRCAESLEELGDKYEAANTWLWLLNIIEGFKARNRDDVQLQVMAMDRYLELCEDLDWTQHRDYQVNKAWSKGLRDRLKNPDAGKKPADKTADANSAAGLIPYRPGSKWGTVDLSHAVMKRATEGLNLYASANPMYWLVDTLQDEKEKELPLFQDGKIWLKRVGAAKFQALTAPGGKGKDIRFGGVKKPTELWYEKHDADGAYETNYAMFFWMGSNQQEYCATTLNLQPSWKPSEPGGSRAVIFRRSASYFTANVGGAKITLYDENGNGVFGEKSGPVRLNDFRLGAGFDHPLTHPLMDSMRVGKGPLIPFSPFVKVKDAWYAIRAVKNNEQLRFRELDPTAVKTGVIRLKWKGPSKAKPKHLVVKSTGGALGEGLFDVASAGSKGVEVPAGEYKILYGRVYNGKAPKNMDAVILEGDSKRIVVAEGQTTVLQMGTPFRIDFVPERSGKDITVSTAKMWVVDRSGARWTCLISEMLEPELVAARDQHGKGAKVLAAWRRVSGNETDRLVKNYPGKDIMALAAFAVDKAGKEFRFEQTVKNPYSGPSFLGLRQKKHRLFGKLLPVWK